VCEKDTFSVFTVDFRAVQYYNVLVKHKKCGMVLQMSASIDEIIARIEKLRRELGELGEKEGLDDPSVLTKSEKLDKAINEYYERKQVEVFKKKEEI